MDETGQLLVRSGIEIGRTLEAIRAAGDVLSAELGPEEHLRTFTRDGIVAFRARRWAGARGGAFVVGNVEHLAEGAATHELFERFPTLDAPEPYVPVGVTSRISVSSRSHGMNAL